MPKLPIPKKKSGGSRARKAGDEATNARKRYVRQAERYMRQADMASGTEFSRMRFLAAEAVSSALQTYEKIPALSRMSSSLRNLAQRLDIPIEPALNRKERAKVIAQSDIALDRKLSKSEREEYIGKKLMSSFVGHRIIAATKHIWEDKATVVGEDGKTVLDREAMEKAIFEYFGAENWFQVIKQFEQNIPDLYDKPKSKVAYDEVIIAAREVFRV